MKESTRRNALKGVLSALAVGLGLTKVTAAEKKVKSGSKVVTGIVKSDDVPLFSGGVAHGNLSVYCRKGRSF